MLQGLNPLADKLDNIATFDIDQVVVIFICHSFDPSSSLVEVVPNDELGLFGHVERAIEARAMVYLGCLRRMRSSSFSAVEWSFVRESSSTKARREGVSLKPAALARSEYSSTNSTTTFPLAVSLLR